MFPAACISSRYNKGSSQRGQRATKPAATPAFPDSKADLIRARRNASASTRPDRRCHSLLHHTHPWAVGEPHPPARKLLHFFTTICIRCAYCIHFVHPVQRSSHQPSTCTAQEQERLPDSGESNKRKQRRKKKRDADGTCCAVHDSRRRKGRQGEGGWFKVPLLRRFSYFEFHITPLSRLQRRPGSPVLGTLIGRRTVVLDGMSTRRHAHFNGALVGSRLVLFWFVLIYFRVCVRVSTPTPILANEGLAHTGE